jgi:hypothetical protein
MSTTSGPIVPIPMMMVMNVEHLVECELVGETEVLRDNLPDIIRL